jgi:hypothetical protein
VNQQADGAHCLGRKPFARRQNDGDGRSARDALRGPGPGPF